MSVYVDPLLNHGGSDTFRWKFSCHMYADTLDELHAMADAIAMKRSWFQDDKRLPHYDLNVSRRIAAVKHGAIETTLRQMVTHMSNNDDVIKDAIRDVVKGVTR
jgi:Protein of unknown function (DUF4031)